MKLTNRMIGALLGSLALFASHGTAAEITWQTPTIMTADTDVSTNGELRFAINSSGADVTFFAGETDEFTFQGISEPALTPAAVGTASFSTSLTGSTGANTFNTGDLGGAGSENIALLVGSGFWGGPQGGLSTFSDLVPGQEYEIQIFSNDARNRNRNFVSMFSNGLASDDPNYVQFSTIVPINNSPVDEVNDPPGPEHGSYVIGTFVADDTTQSFEGYGSNNGGTSANSGGRLQINAIQLRAIGEILPIPDPDPNKWTGLQNGNLDNTTDNFALNAEDEPLQQGNLGNVNADDGEAVFADTYTSTPGGTVDVGTSTLTIPSGAGPTASKFIFNNSADTDYSVTSVDEIGITGATTSLLTEDPDSTVAGNGGMLTLLGTHTYEGDTYVDFDTILNLGDASTGASLSSGMITVNGDLIVDTTSGDQVLTSNIVGAGIFEKIGPGTLTLEGSSNGFSAGTTLLTEGNIVATGVYNQSSIDIASGTVFEHSVTSGFNTVATYTGDGTLRLSNNGANMQIRGAMQLGPDAVIEIASGIQRGSGNNKANWTQNLASLDIASGAQFNGVEGRIRVDALTGGGNLTTGWTSTAYLNQGFTIGVAGGSGTFSGEIADNDTAAEQRGIIRKVGAGTQVFSGFVLHTGNTIIEDGTLEIAEDGLIAAYPGASTVSNQILGVEDGLGTLELNGMLDIDYENIELADGNYWVLIDNTNLNVVYDQSTFRVTDFPDGNTWTETTPGVWSINKDGFELNFEEASGALFVGDPFPLETDPIMVTSTNFDGTTFEVTFENLVPSASYQLRRSPDIESGFTTDVDAVFTGGATATFTDTAPPAGKAFYQLVELP
ncbi:MAG: autotransporter-associated beta strand repeat-containing protein [Verrucomicrobiota bacterium JB023]|nr:autotransporter-associated beta strand repeat-containing protein [Verrucomicrobiota bacterium JB023]